MTNSMYLIWTYLLERGVSRAKVSMLLKLVRLSVVKAKMDPLDYTL